MPEATPRMADAMEEAKRTRSRRTDALLYVAMDAGGELLDSCAAAGDAGTSDCWYAYAQAGSAHLGAAPLVRAGSIGLRWEAGIWPKAARARPRHYPHRIKPKRCQIGADAHAGTRTQDR